VPPQLQDAVGRSSSSAVVATAAADGRGVVVVGAAGMQRSALEVARRDGAFLGAAEDGNDAPEGGGLL
jgi:hypothetical protein